MLEIIPAIDIIDGKCVRLSGGDYALKTVYPVQPTEVARVFEDAGFRRLHLVDLDGARAGVVRNWKVLDEICRETSLEVDFSGGISSSAQVQRSLDAGAAWISVGSIAVRQPDVFLGWISRFGSGKFILGADVKGTELVVRGWTEHSGKDIFGLLKEFEATGLRQVFCTDVSKDGMLNGPATALYTKLVAAFPDLHLIASGGVSSLADIAALQAAGCRGVIIGKAFYEGRIKPEELRNYVN